MSDSSQTPHKVIISGLNAAGKTSIIRRVFDKEDLGYLQNIEPTRRISRVSYNVGEHQLYIWDLGGQESYREEYLRKPEIFMQVDLIIFVLDVLDRNRIEESLNYLRDVLNLCRELDGIKDFVVLLHKTDPDKFSGMASDVFKLTKEIKGMKDMYPFEIKVYTTSIYVETLEYAFDKIFRELGIEINLRDAEKMSTGVYLKERVIQSSQEASDTTTELDRDGMEYIQEYLRLRNLAPTENFEEFYSSVLKIYRDKNLLTSPQSILNQAVEPFKNLLLQYLVHRCNVASNQPEITQEQIDTMALLMGQLNLLKRPMYHYLTTISTSVIENTISFGESIISLLYELILTAYLNDLMTADEYMQVASLLRYRSSFNLIDFQRPQLSESGNLAKVDWRETYLQFLQTQKELISHFQSRYLDTVEERMERYTVDNETKSVIQILVNSLDYLPMQFWYYIQNQQLSDFEITKLLNTKFASLTLDLIQGARTAQILSGEEQNKLILAFQSIY